MFSGSIQTSIRLFFLLSLPVCLFMQPAFSKDTAKSPGHILKDDGPTVSSFAQMRSSLLAAIKSRDKKYIDDLLSENVVGALGGGKGKKDFAERWQNFSAESPFWTRLQRALLHGAQYDAEVGEFHAPAVSFDDNHSRFPQAIVWSKNAGLLKSKDDLHPTRLLFGEQVSLLEPSAHEPLEGKWAKIKCADGSQGSIKSADVYSAYDEFAVFRKIGDRWALTWFGFAGL
jgi:hypothetical protein